MSKVNLLKNKNASTNRIQHLRKLIILSPFLTCILLIYVYKTGNTENINPTAFGNRNSANHSQQVSANHLLDKKSEEVEPKSTTSEPKPKIIVNNSERETSSDQFQYPNYTDQELNKINAAKKCYRMNESDSNLQLLDDIENPPPKPDKSIFFIDTTCLSSSPITLNARKACAIESAAALNPNRDVYVLFLSPVGFVENDPDLPVMAVLKSYPNVYFRHVDIYNISKNTPAEQWIKKDRIFLSGDFRFHMTDYLRFLLLFKYGGVYQDMDFINIKSLDGLPPNFAPQENKDYINSSTLGFSVYDIGHKIIEIIFRECFEKYLPYTWDYNGPLAVRRGAEKICNKTKVIDLMRPEYCWGLKITPKPVFFPFEPFTEAFDTNPQIVKKVLNKITNETVAIHLWSSQTSRIKIVKSVHTSAYSILARKFCPKAFASSATIFDK